MKRIQTAVFGVPEFEMKQKRIYRPRISSEQMRRLWLAKKNIGKSIANLINQAIDYYFDNPERG